MSKSKGELVSVKIIPNEQGNPPGKLADAEVVFEAESGPLSGMKLIGFAVWERRDGGRNVTFPARQVLRERGTPELRIVATRQRGAQCAGGDQAVHPRRVQPRPGSRLIDPGHPGGAGSAPPPGAVVVSRWARRVERDTSAGFTAGVRERKKSWRP